MDDFNRLLRSFFLGSHIILGSLIVLCHTEPASAQNNQGMLSIDFKWQANKKPIVLQDSSYTNPFGETYSIKRLNFYCSHLSADQQTLGETYWLLKAEEENSLTFPLPTGHYKYISFVLGVDSLDNCSGAQSGPLDPMNDMFWTWNSGYVFFKFEGQSAASTADLQRIEYHIGGYKAGQQVARLIRLRLPDNEMIKIKQGQTTLLQITLDLDYFWKAAEEIRISQAATCMQPGPLAQKIASNFTALFSLQKRLAKQ
jgi:hypothetical protein